MAAERERWFIKMEIDLVTGRSIRLELTREETVQLASRLAPVGESEIDPDLMLVRTAFNTLLYRIEVGEGNLVLPDSDGKSWILPAQSIAAVGFEHRLDSPGKHPVIRIGFLEPNEKVS